MYPKIILLYAANRFLLWQDLNHIKIEVKKKDF